MKRGHLL